MPSSQKSLGSNLCDWKGTFSEWRACPSFTPVTHSGLLMNSLDPEISYLPCVRWRCWSVPASWLPGFPMRWSPCGQLLEGQTPFPYSSPWCPPFLPNLQRCTIPSSTRSSITDLPAARLVAWEQRRRSLWKTLGKIQKLEMNCMFFGLKCLAVEADTWVEAEFPESWVRRTLFSVHQNF